MEASATGAAAAARSGYALPFSGKGFGIFCCKAANTSQQFMLSTRLNYCKLSGGRVLQKPVNAFSMSMSMSKLKHEFQDSESNGFLKRRHILHLVGLDSWRAPLETFEKLSIIHSEIPRAVDELLGTICFEEAAILSTRDQFEIYMVAKSEDISVQAIIEWMAKKSGIPTSELQRLCHIDRENLAARHLFEVAAGLHSNFVGEGQILAQIEGIVTSLKGAETFGMIMSKLFEHAISVGTLVSQIDRDERNENSPLWKSFQAQQSIDQEVSKLESWRNNLEISEILKVLDAYVTVAQLFALEEQLLKMGDDVPLDVRRALRKLSWDMRDKFLDVTAAKMLGRLDEKK